MWIFVFIALTNNIRKLQALSDSTTSGKEKYSLPNFILADVWSSVKVNYKIQLKSQHEV